MTYYSEYVLENVSPRELTDKFCLVRRLYSVLDYLIIIPVYEPISYRLYIYDRVKANWTFNVKLPVFHRGVAELAIATDSKTHKARLYFLWVESHKFGLRNLEKVLCLWR